MTPPALPFQVNQFIANYDSRTGREMLGWWDRRKTAPTHHLDESLCN
jgi:hypothetical protein